MRKFLRKIALESGRVIGGIFSSLEEDDLPRVAAGVAGGYTNMSASVDQWGRVVAAASGAAAGLTIGDAIASGRADGSVLYENASGHLAISPDAESFFYDHDGSIGDLSTPRTLYVGDGNSNSTSGVLAIWSDANTEWLLAITASAVGDISISEAGRFVAIPGTLRVQEGLEFFGAGSAGNVFIQAGAAPTLDLVSVQDNSNLDLFRINKNGYVFIKKTAAPANAEIATSEVSLWWTNTVAATQVNFKGKDSAGTAVSHVLKGSNTGDQTITLTGDVTGSGTGSFATTVVRLTETAGPTALTIGAVADGQFLKRSGSTLIGATSSSGGGADPITSIYPLFTASGVDDEFDDGSFSGWTLVDDGTHQATVTETNNVCSILLPGGDTAAHLHAWMKTTTVNSGDIIECAIRGLGLNQNFNLFGLIMANGTTYGAGAQVVWLYNSTSAFFQRIPFTNYNTAGAGTTYSVNGREPISDVFLRLKYEGSNNWSGYCSPDGVSWVNLTGTFAVTLTPSALGFFTSTWGGAAPYAWSVRYFRKTT